MPGTRRMARLGIAAVAVTGLVASGAGTDGAFAAPRARTISSTTPLIAATVANGQLTLRGPSSFPAGRLSLSLTAKGKEAEIDILSLAPGYTFADVRADLAAFGQSFGPNGPSKKGLAHYNHALDNTTLYGGLHAGAGQTSYGQVLLPTAGSYAIFNDTGNLPKQKTWLHVGSPSGPQSLKATDATVTAVTKRRFRGATVLPASGNVTFTNQSTNSPHFLGLEHVKAGTTKHQVIKAFSTGKPDVFLPGEAGTDAVDQGHSMTFHVHVPAGTYAEFCFIPDPETGVPHAFMGMVRIVHLR